MAAPKNNQFWKQRSKHGRDKIFQDPETLWEAACEYFDWCDKNPWHKESAAKAGDHFGEVVNERTARPYTLQGLCIFLECDENTIERYCKEVAYKDFWDIANKIRRIIYTQKFEGAAVGAFNASIIARDLGLKDHQDHGSSDGTMTPQIIVSSKKAGKAFEKLADRHREEND